MAAGAVAAVVAEGDGLGEGDVEAERPGHRRGDLGDLEGVGEPGALVVVGEDEHLGLAGQPAERRGVEDAVAVALEAGAPLVGLLGHGAVAGAAARVAAGGQHEILPGLAGGPVDAARRPARACESAWASRTACRPCRAPAIVDAQRSARSGIGHRRHHARVHRCAVRASGCHDATPRRTGRR